MDKNLWIDLDVVNNSIAVLGDELMHLNDAYDRVKVITAELPDAWQGQKTAQIYGEVEEFSNSINKISESIYSIKNAVSQYSKNVESADTAVNLNSSDLNV